LSRRLSRQLLETELNQQRAENMSHTGWYYEIPNFNLMAFNEQMSTEELLASFDVSMTVRDIVVFYGIGIGVILISSVVPVVYIMRLNPKEILM